VISQSDYIFPPPPVAALNEFYGRQLWYYREAVRAMPQGLAFFIRATDENFQIRGIGTYDVVQQLFNLAGIQVRRSKPGLIARQLIQQFGDLQACRVLKIPGVRALIEKYGPTESFVRSHAIQTIRDLDFAAHTSLYIEKRSHQSLTPDDVFAFLLNKEVFRAGLELECPNCQLTFWKHVDDCVTKLPCDYCGKLFNITPQLQHRGDWRFRRSGLFGATDHQEGSIPVLLTLQQIEANIHEHPLSYMTALKLDGLGVDCETDFVVIHSRYHGTVEIVLSECKTGDEISQQDIDNLSAVAGKLDTIGLKVFLLLSKTAAFSQEEIDRCKRIRERATGGTILLSAREPEPYFMYEQTRNLELRPTAFLLTTWSRQHDGFTLSRNDEHKDVATQTRGRKRSASISAELDSLKANGGNFSPVVADSVSNQRDPNLVKNSDEGCRRFGKRILAKSGAGVDDAVGTLKFAEKKMTCSIDENFEPSA